MMKKLSMITLGVAATFLCITIFPQHKAEATEIIVTGKHCHFKESGVAGCVKMSGWDNFRAENFTTSKEGKYEAKLRYVDGGYRYIVGAGSNVCGAAHGGMVKIKNSGTHKISVNY